MSTLLQINSSPLPTSVSRELSAEFVQTWKASHPHGTVITRDLSASPPRLIDLNWIQASYTPEANRTPAQTAELALSEQLIGELERASDYVIGVAMHNFSIPAVLKLWIDQVSRKGRTFTYTSAGPEGLLKGKKATIIIATGGMYGDNSPAKGMNFADPYLKTVLSFLGVTDITVISAGGVAQLASGSIDRPTFLKPSLEKVRALAA